MPTWLVTSPRKQASVLDEAEGVHQRHDSLASNGSRTRRHIDTDVQTFGEICWSTRGLVAQDRPPQLHD